MCTFGVRTPSRVLLLVGTDAEETEESFLLRPLPLCESLLLAMPSESLPRLHTLPRLHYHIKSIPLPDQYRCRHLLRTHPNPFPLLCRHSHAPRDPLKPHPHSLHLLSSLNRLFRCHHRFLPPAPFVPFPMAALSLVVVLLPQSVPPSRSMSLFPPLSAVAQAHVEAISKAQ